MGEKCMMVVRKCDVVVKKWVVGAKKHDGPIVVVKKQVMVWFTSGCAGCYLPGKLRADNRLAPPFNNG